VLGIAKEATDAELRRSYYKVSLKVHPDRAPEDPRATEKFQVLGKLYSVLSDKDQRKVYDEQGVVDEEGEMPSCWEENWRRLFPKITVQDILEFEQKYKGSDEERQDVIQLYVQHQGNMDVIMDSALCCSQEDEPRLRNIISDAIQTGEVTPFPAFTQESERKRKARERRFEKERQEAEEMKREMGLGEQDDSLATILKQRQKSREQNFNSFLSDLEAKYSKKGGNSQKVRKGKK